jgi:ribose/xylose/arabinose/galactoside ABC-type transport system permease subunit
MTRTPLRLRAAHGFVTDRVNINTAREFGIFIALGLLIVVFSLASPVFATSDNALLILKQVSVNGIIAIGMTIVIITAGIDLSVGALLAVAVVVSAEFAAQTGTTSLVLAFVIPIVIGAIGGGINGIIVAYGYVTPLIVTLGTLTAYRGFITWYRIEPVYELRESYVWIGQGDIAGIPAPVIVFGIVAVLASVMLNRTRFGRHVYAVGGNEEAAKASGINVARVKLAVYVICGICAGIGGLVFTARIGAGQSVAGQGFELQAIAAAVLGGASLFGGEGRISNTVAGALIMGVLLNGLVLLNVDFAVQQMIIGVIIVAAVWVDGLIRRHEARPGGFRAALRRHRTRESGVKRVAREEVEVDRE